MVASTAIVSSELYVVFIGTIVKHMFYCSSCFFEHRFNKKKGGQYPFMTTPVVISQVLPARHASVKRMWF